MCVGFHVDQAECQRPPMEGLALIEVVVFDADETLWPFHALLAECLTAALEEVQRLVPGDASRALTADDIQADRAAALDALPADTLLLDVRRAGFRRTLRRLGCHDDAATQQVFDAFFAARFAGIRPYDDVQPCLDELRDRYRIAYLTNGNSHPRHVGWEDRFEVVVLAQDHGFHKPDRRVFDLVRDKLGVPAERLVKVGDSLEHDILGATAAGWHAVWINRGGADDRPPPAEVAIITSLADLPAALERIDATAAVTR